MKVIRKFGFRFYFRHELKVKENSDSYQQLKQKEISRLCLVKTSI